MKKRLGVSILTALALVGLVSCNGGTPSEDPTSDPTTSTPEVPGVDRIDIVPLETHVLVGDTLDLSEKVTVHFTDGTSDHTSFTILPAVNGEFEVNGSVVTFLTFGLTTLEVCPLNTDKVAAYYDVNVKTAERVAFDAWFNSIENTYDVLALSQDAEGNVGVAGWATHKEQEYFLQFFGSNINNVTAKLADGHFYAGEYTNFDPVAVEFAPGVQQWGDNYGEVGLDFFEITADSFESVVAEDGSELIVGSAAFAERLLNITCALTYGGDATGIVVLGIGADDEGEIAAVNFAITYVAEDVDENGDPVTVEAYDLYQINSVGTVADTDIEAIQSDLTAVPQAIETTHIQTALDALAPVEGSHDYILQVEVNQVSANGTPITAETLDTAFFSFVSMQQQTVVTDDVVLLSTAFDLGEGLEQDTPVGVVKGNDGQVYLGSLEVAEDGSQTPKVEALPGSTVYNAASDLGLTAEFLNAGGIDDLVFDSYQESPLTDAEGTATGAAHIYTSDAGVNDGTTDTTEFLYALLIQQQLLSGLVQGYNSFAELMCTPVESSTGNMFAPCENGSLQHVVILDTEGNVQALQVTFLWSLSTFGWTAPGAAYLQFSFTYLLGYGSIVAAQAADLINGWVALTPAAAA